MTYQNTTPGQNHHIRFSFLFWTAILAVFVAVGGVGYALIKNEQYKVRTDIERTRRDIANSTMNTNHFRAKTQEMCNRWAMLDRLKTDNSTLRAIDRQQIETALNPQGEGEHTASLH